MKFERRQKRLATMQPDEDATGRRTPPEAGGRVTVEFRPAAWLLAAVELVRLWLERPKLGRRAVAGLAWRFLPRKLRLIASGAAALALLVLVGAFAAIVLLISQLA